MATDAVVVKIMPASPDVNLDMIKKSTETVIKKIGGSVHKIEEQPIAFGLKALIVMIAWPEEKNPDVIESELSKIKDVNSAEITDVRRAIG